MSKFVHLHVHTQYSILDGQAAVSALVDKAMADGMPAIAITDHGNMFAIKEFYNYVAKKNSKTKGAIKDALAAAAEAEKTGDTAVADEKRAEAEKLKSKIFKPILGCEVYVANETLDTHTDKHDTGRHLILLAKNETGYHNLVKIVSRAWTDGFYSHPRTDKSDILAHKEGIIVCSACLGGEIPRLILQDNIEEAERRVMWWKENFGDDYYLELQRHKATVARANHDTYPLQQKVNAELVRMAEKFGIKIICTNDTHFVNEDDAEAHERLICLSTGKKISDENRMLYSKQEWLKTTEEMAQVFSDYPEALANTIEIADKVEFYDIDHSPIMPFFAIPEEFGTEEEYRSRITEQDLFDEFTRDENGNVVLSQEEAENKIKKLGGYDKLYRIKFEADYLGKLAYEGAERRYGAPLTPEIEERIKFELHIMKTMGFPGYFLIVQDFINVSRESLGVSVGPGRGSAAGSCVAYCLGITQIDPIKYDLLFERFLNPDRISLPDIDVDFDDDGRARVLQYVTEKYGAENVAHIITYGTMATKMALKDVARVEGLPIPESDRIVKLLPKHMPEVNGKEAKMNLTNCYNLLSDFKTELNNPNPLVRETLKYAEKLEGNVRGTGVHACGVIICRDKISDWVPVSTAVDKQEGKLLVTQYEGRVIEETGLIKMDFLGLKTLSIIMEAVSNIKHTHGIDIDMEKIPIDDPATYKLYCEGRTVGTFQFESAGMQKYLRELQPSTFEDLIAMNALYRPGPMDYIPEFISRKHGKTPIVYDIPVMEQYLKDTYGVTVYQEQVMLLSRLLANFTRGESDTLRKAMGKKLIDKMNHLKGKFLEGGQTNGHDPKVLEKIWADWEKFASYAFNKSHATCYSWVAFQTAYLKANYPAEYMAAVMSRNSSDITKLTVFMDECKAMRLTVKGPDVNESFTKFSVNEDGDIRFGLAAIKGVGDNVVAAIIRTREEGGRFESPYDFVERVPAGIINRRTFDNLVCSGAFDWYKDLKREDYFEKNNRDETFSEQLVRYGQKFQNASMDQSASLFGEMEPELRTAGRPLPKYAEPWPDTERLDKEKELVGMYLSSHPLDPFYMEVNHGLLTIKKFQDLAAADGMEACFGGTVSHFEQRPAKRGGFWGALTLEDYTGSIRVMLFGQKFVDFSKYGVPGYQVMVRGRFRFSTYKNEMQFEVEHVCMLEDVRGRIIEGITLMMDPTDITEAFLKDLYDHQSSTGTGKGALNVQLYDPQIGRSVRLVAGMTVPVNRDLVNLLDAYNISYEFVRNRAITGATPFNDFADDSADVAEEEMIAVETD
ncbi:MAG: DNA polymerase III subunit alpha [Bacteroidales bacterium]|nr:DNA polymerase III subunit alpha [Bacteroidales bacterium]